MYLFKSSTVNIQIKTGSSYLGFQTSESYHDIHGRNMRPNCSILPSHCALQWGNGNGSQGKCVCLLTTCVRKWAGSTLTLYILASCSKGGGRGWSIYQSQEHVISVLFFLQEMDDVMQFQGVTWGKKSYLNLKNPTPKFVWLEIASHSGSWLTLNVFNEKHQACERVKCSCD